MALYVLLAGMFVSHTSKSLNRNLRLSAALKMQEKFIYGCTMTRLQLLRWDISKSSVQT